jgi:tetratricopeptide (TPR) repeat protein
MNCPVCPRTDIPSLATACPNCGVNLVPLNRPNELARDRFNEAVRMARSSQTTLAICHANAALSIDERFVPARKLLGKLLWKKDSRREAIEQWEQAAALDQDDKEISRLLIEAKRDLRGHRTIRIAGLSFTALFVLVLIAVVTIIQPRITASRHAALSLGLEKQLENMRTESVRASAETGAWKKEAERSNKRAEDFREVLRRYKKSHGHSDFEFATVVNERDLLRQQMEGTRTRPAFENGSLSK